MVENYGVFKEDSGDGGYWIVSTNPLTHSMDGNDAIFGSYKECVDLIASLILNEDTEYYISSENYARSNPSGGPKRPH